MPQAAKGTASPQGPHSCAHAHTALQTTLCLISPLSPGLSCPVHKDATFLLQRALEKQTSSFCLWK